jgi:hypothetical protein
MSSPNRTKFTGKTKLTREVVELILDMVGDCDANCLDYMYDVGKPLDFNVYGKCMDNCIAEISKKLNIPIEKIYKIIRDVEIEPMRWW